MSRSLFWDQGRKYLCIRWPSIDFARVNSQRNRNLPWWRVVRLWSPGLPVLLVQSLQPTNANIVIAAPLVGSARWEVKIKKCYAMQYSSKGQFYYLQALPVQLNITIAMERMQSTFIVYSRIIKNKISLLCIPAQKILQCFFGKWCRFFFSVQFLLPEVCYKFCEENAVLAVAELFNVSWWNIEREVIHAKISSLILSFCEFDRRNIWLVWNV